MKLHASSSNLFLMMVRIYLRRMFMPGCAGLTWFMVMVSVGMISFVLIRKLPEMSVSYQKKDGAAHLEKRSMIWSWIR
nr:hypothetical protein [Tanacetum cinerariifolium]